MKGVIPMLLVLSVLVLLSLAGGCQNMVPLSHGPLKVTDSPANLTIQVDELAVNARKKRPNQIGTHSFSVFAIPAGDINTEKPLPELMHPFVVEALESAGYSLVDIRGKKAANMPVLRGEITNFWFAGYSWFWPVYVRSGNIKYRMVLQKPNGTMLWEKTLKSDGAGTSFGADSGYENMINPTITKLLNKVIDTVHSDEFKAALKQN